MARILVVDDELDILTAYRMILSLEGYEVMVAADGQEALECLAQSRPDIILSDMMMPRIDGLELCRLVRNDPQTQDIPLILSSSVEPPAPPDPDPCWDVFLRKPVALNTLLEVIERLLASRARDAG